MGMDFKLTFYAADHGLAKQAAVATFDRVAALNAILSDYDPQSELSRLSATSGENRWVSLSPELWLVLARSQQMADRTGGAFDVTVGPLTRLWRRSRRQRELPAPRRLKEALAAVGYQYLKLDPDKKAAKLIRPGMRLDLGGIAAGYAVDEALRVLADHGITRALVDASGDIAAGDPPPDRPAWRVEIALGEKSPPAGSRPQAIELKQAAVTGAGDTAQFVEIGGQRYSHIVDPRTGLGLTSRVNAVVIARDCITADSLDTAASVLGPRAGLALVRQVPGAEARIVVLGANEDAVYQSDGFARWLAP